MSEIFEIDKLLIFLLFFIPGFISLKVYKLIVASEKIVLTPDDTDMVMVINKLLRENMEVPANKTKPAFRL